MNARAFKHPGRYSAGHVPSSDPEWVPGRPPFKLAIVLVVASAWSATVRVS